MNLLIKRLIGWEREKLVIKVNAIDTSGLAMMLKWK